MKGKASVDSRASINVMPYKLILKPGLAEPTPTWTTLHFADRSMRHHRGVIEDVLVKVNKLIFPVDFVILDVDEDTEVPINLGHLFLATYRALIDVCDGKLILLAGNKEAIFKLPRRHETSHKA